MTARLPHSLGFRVLGVWLVLHALLSVTGYSMPGAVFLQAILAFAAGALILMGR